MFQQEQERALKEDYLRINVIEKGIDPQAFQDYCESLKGEESDIDKWTFEEIVTLVNTFNLERNATFNFDFDHSNSNEQAWDAFDLQIESIPQNTVPQLSPEVQKPQPDIYQLDVSAFEQSFMNTQQQSWDSQYKPQQQQNQVYNASNITTAAIITSQAALQLQTPIQTQVQQREINSQSIQQSSIQPKQQPQIVPSVPIPIPIPNPTSQSAVQSKYKIICKRLGQNIFKELSIRIDGTETRQAGLLKSDYVVYKIKANEFEVHRRFSDFVWLRETLMKLFPGISVPQLTVKTLNKSAKSTVEKRRILLEFFLQETAKIFEFRNSKYFVDFLRETDPKKFKEMVKFAERIHRPTKFENLINSQGEVHFIEELSVGQFENVLSQEEFLFEKIKEQFKSVTKHLDSIQKLLIDIQEEMRILDQLSLKNNIQSHYSEFQQRINKLEIDIVNQNQNTYSKLYNVFRYQNSNFSSIKGNFKLKADLTQELQTRKDSVKELSYVPDAKSKIDELDMPSKNTKLLYHQLAFVNWRIAEEMQSFIGNRILSFDTVIKQI